MPGYSRRHARRWIWALSLCSVAACAAVFTASSRSTSTIDEISTAIGERETFSLTGGVQILLNTHTRIRTHTTRTAHEITVAYGEILASVPPPADREYAALPVVFHVRGVDVETSSAQLRIRMDVGGAMIVDVLSGSGVLRSVSSQQVVHLGSGESAQLPDGEVIIVTRYESERMKRVLSWQDGDVWLSGDTLEYAVAEFNRYNLQKVVVLDRELSQFRISGRFETTDVDGFISGLERTFGIRALVVRSGGAGASTVLLLPPEVEAGRQAM
jgi:transmembrane sensor